MWSVACVHEVRNLPAHHVGAKLVVKGNIAGGNTNLENRHPAFGSRFQRLHAEQDKQQNKSSVIYQ